MTQCHQGIDQFGRGIGRLGAKQADAQANQWQAILFCRGQAGIYRVDHVRQAAVPRRPVGPVDDHISVARPTVGQPPAVSVAQFGQPFPGRRQAASPVEEVQEVRQAFELEQAFAGPGHEHVRLGGPLLQDVRLKAAFEMGMNLSLGQRAKSIDLKGLHVGHRGTRLRARGEAIPASFMHRLSSVIRPTTYPVFTRPATSVENTDSSSFTARPPGATAEPFERLLGLGWPAACGRLDPTANCTSTSTDWRMVAVCRGLHCARPKVVGPTGTLASTCLRRTPPRFRTRPHSALARWRTRCPGGAGD